MIFFSTVFSLLNNDTNKNINVFTQQLYKSIQKTEKSQNNSVVKAMTVQFVEVLVLWISWVYVFYWTPVQPCSIAYCVLQKSLHYSSVRSIFSIPTPLDCSVLCRSSHLHCFFSPEIASLSMVKCVCCAPLSFAPRNININGILKDFYEHICYEHILEV